MEVTHDQSSEGLELVRVLATVLDRLCVANASMARADPGQVTKFHAMKAPGIGILQYLERIHKYASCSNECFVLALIYIDRLIQRNNFLLTELNVHRVVITAVLLAAKFFDDAYYNNAYYAKVGGVLVSEMNGLEVDFLFRINFSLHVTPEVFEKYRAELMSQASVCTSMQQEVVPAATVSPPLQPYHQPTSPVSAPPVQAPVAVTTPPMVCNPQAAVAQNFVVAPDPSIHQLQQQQSAISNPFAHATSQITPPPAPTQMAYGGDAPLQFPVAFDGSGFTQLQRANSLPIDTGSVYPPSTAQPSAGATTKAECHSAPAIITPAVHYPNVSSADVAAMMEQQIFPLQNALVHHQHPHHHQALGAPPSIPYAIQPKADPRGHVLLTGGVL